MTTAGDVMKLDKKALRALADKMGVVWDKRTDDEDTLRKKVRAKLDAEEDGEYDISQRAPLREVIDEKTRQKVKRPMECFGWYHDPANQYCQGCKYQQPCSKLAKGADKAIKELNAEGEAEEEVEALDESDVKAIKDASEKHAKKKAKELPEKRKGMFGPTDKLKVSFDLDWAKTHDDDDFRPFFKAVAKKFNEGAIVQVKAITAMLHEHFELNEDEAQEVLTALVGSEAFEKVKS